MRKLPDAATPLANKTAGFILPPSVAVRSETEQAKCVGVVQCIFENKIKLHRVAALAARKFFGFLRKPISPYRLFTKRLNKRNDTIPIALQIKSSRSVRR